jgi:hypothetical protein
MLRCALKDERKKLIPHNYLPFQKDKYKCQRYEKSKMLWVFFVFFYYIWNYIINGDKIYFVPEINISGGYLRLKKRYMYLKSLS